MTSTENEDLEFAIKVLKKTLITKDDKVKQIKDLHQIQINVMMEEIDQRDQLIDELKEEIESMKENKENQIQKLTAQHTQTIRKLEFESQRLIDTIYDHQKEKENLNCKLKQFQERSDEQANDIASLTKEIEDLKDLADGRNKSDEILFRHIQRHYGCNAVWALTDLKFDTGKIEARPTHWFQMTTWSPCFKVKRRSNLIDRGFGQSSTYMDVHRYRLNICDHCEDNLGQFSLNSNRDRDVQRKCLVRKGAWNLNSLRQYHCKNGSTCSTRKLQGKSSIYNLYQHLQLCEYLHCDLE